MEIKNDMDSEILTEKKILRSGLSNGAVFVSDYKNRKLGYLISFLDNSVYFLDCKNCNSCHGVREVSYCVSEFIENNIDSVSPCTDTWPIFTDLRLEYVYGINIDCFENKLYDYEKEIIDLFTQKFDTFMIDNGNNLNTKFISIEKIQLDTEGTIISRGMLGTF
jgi:hypothetical protein